MCFEQKKVSVGVEKCHYPLVLGMLNQSDCDSSALPFAFSRL
jgi:hypothetical protein